MRSVVLLFASVAVAADWPRFHGPNGSGRGDALTVKWSVTENRLWQVEVPGAGNGSPIVVKGKVYLQAAAGDGAKRSLICLDAATGKEVWTASESGRKARTHAKNSLASSTPASDGERIYCCFWDGAAVTLTAYDPAGHEVWKQPLGNFTSQHGAGLSPMVHAGKVFVNFDQDGAAEAMAFDAKTGQPAWKKTRKAYRACYSTPNVRELPGGGSEVLFFSTAGLTAYDPASGKVNWEQAFTWDRMALRSIASPVILGDVIICVTGDGGGSRWCAGIQAGPNPKFVWENKSGKVAPYVPCPVALGKHLFWITDKGVLQCINPLTGVAVWSESVFGSAVSASPVLLGDSLLLIDEKGKAITCKVDARGMEKVGETSFNASVIATPAAVDGKLYLRAGTSLYCFGAK